MKAPWNEPRGKAKPTLGATMMLTGFEGGGDGYDWMAKLDGTGWFPIAGWGLDGWDLGDWPLVVYGHAHDGDDWLLVEYVEGDVTVWKFATKDDLYAATDTVARRVWERDPEHYGEAMVAAIRDRTAGAHLPAEFRGRFSWGRLDKEEAK